jgi:DNA polymerase-4
MSDRPRRIIHVDMDAFFAAVEQRDDPSLRGKPVVVGGSPEHRGVVATASYEARVFGIHSAMPMSRAVRLCPNLIRISGHYAKYGEASRQIMAILRTYTPLVEQVSVDEAFMDVTGCERLHGDAIAIARDIRRRIRQEVGLTASVGVAPSKFMAKLCSDMHKPDGLTVVEAADLQDFLRELPIAKLWGVGKATEKSLSSLGIRTVGQLAAYPEEVLARAVGPSHAEHLQRLARGEDDRAVIAEAGPPKSISHETTFAADTADVDFLQSVLLDLSEQVGRRLRKAGLQARTVTLKLRFADFQTLTRNTTLPRPTDTDAAIYAGVRAMLQEVPLRAAVRLIGVGVMNLTEGEAPNLFTDVDEGKPGVDAAVDAIRGKFGKGAIKRARLVEGS